MTMGRDTRVERLAAAAFGPTPSSRELDIARRVLSGSVEPQNAEVRAVLDDIEQEAEDAQAQRLADRRTAAELHAPAMEFWRERGAKPKPPEGTKLIHVRDERTGSLYRLAVPQAFFVD